MKNGIPNKLICGDNLEELKKLPAESVDLIYIDPPFFSNKQYEVVWGDEAEVRSFEDRWEGGVEHYIGWLRPRIEAMYDTLKPTGSFYLHCDWHANAHIRIMLDEIFGAKNLRAEIIWQKIRVKKAQSEHYPKTHDVIYCYTNSNKFIYKQQYLPLEPKYIKSHYSSTDEQGRHYQLVSLIQGGQGTARSFGGTIIEPPTGKHWIWGQERIDEAFKGGLIHFTRTGKPRLKRYLEQSKGVNLGDIWIDIAPVNSQAIERMGYPTQKPEPLLERIIKSSSNEGDVVLDAFCGCGTACVVAAKLKRKWIGIDISPTAIKLIEKRLATANIEKGVDYISIGSPNTVAELKALKPFEFQNWVIDEMSAKHSKRKVGDMGIDGYMDKDLFREAAGIQVKQSESIGRNVVDNFKAALTRAKYKKGYIVAFSFGKGAVEETARLKNAGDVDIELVRVEDLLYKKVVLK